MAKKQANRVVRITTKTVEQGPPQPETGGAELEVDDAEAGADLENLEELDALDKLRELSGGNSLAKFEVRRVLPSALAGYCTTLAGEEMTMERLQDELGPGTYAIRVRLPGGKFAGSDRVQIADLPKHRQPAPLAAAPVVSQPAPAGGGELGVVLAAMQRGTEAQISMLTSLVQSLINKPTPAGADTLDVIEKLAPLLKPEKSDGGADAVKMLLQGIELGKDLGGSGGEAGFADVFMKGLDTIKTVAATQPQPRPSARRAGPAAGTVPAQELPNNPSPPAAVVAQPKREVNPMLRVLQWIKNQTVMLCHQAARQKDPELYAELFLDNLPDGLTEEMVMERMQKPDAIDELATINPMVLQYREWFEQFRDEVIELLQPTEDADEESEEAEAGGQVIEHEPEGGAEGGGEGS
jgi:hypothetical protein